jgi:fimbrial chaperone protein
LKRLITASITLAIALALAGPAVASDIAVAPIQLSIPSGDGAAVMNIQNKSTYPVRLQITGSAWDQQPNGVMKLTPSEDLIFFPTLVTVAPLETQQIRIGVEGGAASTERTFRVFINELPSINEALTGHSIAVRLKVGVPVFVEPSRQVRALAIPSATLASGKIDFSLRNNGTVREMIDKIEVAGLDAGGKTVAGASADAWYVLAGGRRDFSLPFSKAACRSVSSINITAQTNLGPVVLRDVPLANKSCK